MKILFVVQGYDSPSSRYRVLQYLPYLEQEGVETTVATYPKDVRDSAKLYRNVGEHDLVFFQRKRPGPLFLGLVRQRARGMVYDFDDAIMYRNSKASSPHSTTRERRFAQIVKAADHVIAGNAFLRDQARKYTSQVTVIPTAIDMGRYALRQHVRKKKVTIGWIGSRSTLPYLSSIRDVFEELGRRYDNVELKIICDSFFDCKNIPVIKKKWNEGEEIEDLTTLDIGVMPLSNDPWSWGKCGLKILQYYGVGVPVVCTPVGINRDVVCEGVNGFWATTSTGWVEKLGTLIEDPRLRQEMGMRGRQLVKESFSVNVCAKNLYQVLEEVCRRRAE